MKKTKCENCDESSQNTGENIIDGNLPEVEKQPEAEKDNESANKADDTASLIEKKELQISELSDKFMRLAAEYDNYRRRTQKEKDAIYTDCVATVTGAWLPVADNIDRALAASADFQTEEALKIRSGLEMVQQQVKDVMNSLGVEEMNALNQPFDPNLMEAVMHVEDENAAESEVVAVFEKGYKRGDKVIRHAVVKVAN